VASVGGDPLLEEDDRGDVDGHPEQQHDLPEGRPVEREEGRSAQQRQPDEHADDDDGDQPDGLLRLGAVGRDLAARLDFVEDVIGQVLQCLGETGSALFRGQLQMSDDQVPGRVVEVGGQAVEGVFDRPPRGEARGEPFDRRLDRGRRGAHGCGQRDLEAGAGAADDAGEVAGVDLQRLELVDVLGVGLAAHQQRQDDRESRPDQDRDGPPRDQPEHDPDDQADPRGDQNPRSDDVAASGPGPLQTARGRPERSSCEEDPDQDDEQAEQRDPDCQADCCRVHAAVPSMPRKKSVSIPASARISASRVSASPGAPAGGSG
jgi:hypothetical protein